MGIGISLISAVLFLSLLELYLQLTFENAPEDPFQPNPVIGWENKHNFTMTAESSYYGRDVTYSLNSMGLRDTREFGEKTRPRILIVGDSFVYGAGLDQGDMIGRRLEERLPAYEVISAGTIGYSSVQYLQAYQSQLYALDPDIVVFVVYINDFSENTMPTVFGFTKPWTFIYEGDGSLGIARHEVGPRRTVQRPVILTPWFISSKIAALQDKQEAYAVSPLRFNQGWMMMEYPVSERSNWDLLLEAYVLNTSRAVVESSGARFAVVYIPPRVQVDDAYREEVMRHYYDASEFPFHPRLMSENMRDMGEAFGIRVLDMTPLLSQSPSRYYLGDGHLSPEGTVFFDTALQAFLEKEGYIEKR